MKLSELRLMQWRAQRVWANHCSLADFNALHRELIFALGAAEEKDDKKEAQDLQKLLTRIHHARYGD